MTILIRVTDQPAASDAAIIGNTLAAFNAEDIGPSGRKDLAVTVHDGEAFIAGMSGYTAWGWLFVQLLWVDEAARGVGLAGKMLGAAEEEAVRRGCHGAYIDTFNPVALKTYQRAGYEEFGRLEDFPRGRDRVWLKKVL